MSGVDMKYIANALRGVTFNAFLCLQANVNVSWFTVYKWKSIFCSIFIKIDMFQDIRLTNSTFCKKKKIHNKLHGAI